jgi:hypothetical protein
LRRAIALVGLIVLITATIGLYVTLNNGASSSTSGINASSSSSRTVILNYVNGTSCKISGRITLQSGETTLTSFLMLSNSTARLCISYTFGPVQSEHFVNFSQYASITKVVAGPPPPPNQGPGFSYSYVPAQGVSIIANPSSISIPASNSNTTIIVNYTITASSNASGFFSLGYLSMCPPLVPFSIGYGDSAVNASDFHGFFFPSNCPSTLPEIGFPEIIGYAGLGTLSVTAPNETT